MEKWKTFRHQKSKASNTGERRIYAIACNAEFLQAPFYKNDKHYECMARNNCFKFSRYQFLVAHDNLNEQLIIVHIR